MSKRAFVLAAALVVGLTGHSGDAEACGGTFCDAPASPSQPAMPVDQTGENVLFVMADGWVEAHVQIQYEGDPERFAWVIPVPETPELSAGNQLLFANLLDGSVPTFTLTTSFDFCGSNGSSGSSSSAGCMASSDSDDSGGSFTPNGGPGNTNSNAPRVERRESVGAFEAVVLEPQTAQGMLDWLTANGFDSDANDSLPVIGDYVNQGYKFVAVKLRPAAGTDEIHPLVIRYPGNEPCVPLKLTRIAAVEDMTVRVFFLGEERVVPTSYKHVVLNDARLDYRGLGANYNLAIARAVDSPVADGRAFVTEYAGPSSVISNTGLFQSTWKNLDFSQVEAQNVISKLSLAGLVDCSTATCQSSHPLMFPILERHLPVPDGVDPDDFYSCVACYAQDGDPLVWDPTGFQQDFEDIIVEPAERAVSILSTYPYLTRMVTRISPSEMTSDPMFAEWHEPLPDVSNQLSATQAMNCSSEWVTRHNDGRSVAGGTQGTTPTLPADLPWAELVEEFSATGEHVVLLDNADSIDSKLSGFRETTDPTSTGPGTNVSTSGCACGIAGAPPTHGLLVLGLGALGLIRGWRRRRRRRI